ncbi:MAG: tRNA (adenosine(37)-N6)-threonylcarbamoyltransferase complex ATPase subunit type 1 TsaE [Pseudomonadota bacterium]
MLERRQLLSDTAATEALGLALAAWMRSRRGGVVTLHGDLGAGKTTLARACLRALGATGAVKSPTYTLVEPYSLGSLRVLHMDLYRLAEPEELYGLGVFDEPPSEAWWLVEWPEKGGALLPPATLEIHLQAQGESRVARLRGLDSDAFPAAVG